MTPKGSKTRSAGASSRASSGNRHETQEGPNPVDVYVGARVRSRRNEIKMSQGALGDQVGLTFQQIQKYERGMNRIGASRLYEFSTILDVPIGYFYDDMPENVAQAAAFADEALPTMAEWGPETLKLVKLYYRINHEEVRRRLYELVKAVAYDGSR